jgi:ABC-type iron transport system FetAB ATPase subunit
MPLAALARCCSCKTNVSAATNGTTVFWGKDVQAKQTFAYYRHVSFSCCSPQVSGAPNKVSDDEVPIPCLHVTSHPQPSACAASTLPANSDD